MGDVLEFLTARRPEQLAMMKWLGLPHPLRRRVEAERFLQKFEALDESGAVLIAAPLLVTSDQGARHLTVAHGVEGPRPRAPAPKDLLLAVLNGAVLHQALLERQGYVGTVETMLSYGDNLKTSYLLTADNCREVLNRTFRFMRLRQRRKADTVALCASLLRSGLITFNLVTAEHPRVTA